MKSIRTNPHAGALQGDGLTEFSNARRWKRPLCWIRGHVWWGGLGMYGCVRCDKDWHE